MPQVETPVLKEVALPGAEIVDRIRRLIIVALVAGVSYSVLTAAGKGYCVGGADGAGGFTDAAGNPVDTVPSCVTLTLRPSPMVYFAVAAIILWALTRVLRKANGVASALRVLDRAAVAIGVLVAVSILVSQVWFALIPITEWDGTGTFFYPFPFGAVDMGTTP